MESHPIDSPNGIEYGPNALFWITSTGQDIFEFGFTRHYFENPPLGEDEYRRIQASLDGDYNFSERMEIISPSLISYKEPMSALFPRLTDPWHSEYCTLAETLGPIEEVSFSGVISHNPGQTSNPTVIIQRSMSSPPILSST